MEEDMYDVPIQTFKYLGKGVNQSENRNTVNSSV